MKKQKSILKKFNIDSMLFHELVPLRLGTSRIKVKFAPFNFHFALTLK